MRQEERPGPEAEEHHRNRDALLPVHAQTNFLFGMAQTSTGVMSPMMVAMVSGVAQGSCNPVSNGSDQPIAMYIRLPSTFTR